MEDRVDRTFDSNALATGTPGRLHQVPGATRPDSAREAQLSGDKES